MDQDGIHGLTAVYALDALDDVEARQYEEHLRSCARCREELAEFTETAASLAYAVEAPTPSPALRGRILEAARAERTNVVPLRPRRSAIVPVAALAAAAAVVAVALGTWAFSLRGDLDDAREALDRSNAASAVLADPDARSIELSGADGRLVLAADGDAALLVSGLEAAPTGHGYEMWVIRDGRPESAGTFRVENGRALARLDRTVPQGSTVAVTLEPLEGGTDGPDTEPLFTADA